MTLIISVLTDEYVALVSDRRVTWSDGRQVDTDTKTFNLYGEFLMGFTGLARIDGFRMERWVADALRSVPTDEYFNVLAQKMGTAFDRRYVPPTGSRKRCSPLDTQASSPAVGSTP